MSEKSENILKRSLYSGENISDIFENIVECVSRIDTLGKFLSVNKKYAEACGYQIDEMIGMSWRETVLDDDIKKSESLYQEMTEKGRAEGNVRGIRKNGTVFFKHIVMVKGINNEKSSTNHYCFMQDITDTVIKEQQLLLEQSNTQEQLDLQQVTIKRFYEVVSDNQQYFDQKMDRILKIGIDYLKLDIGAFGLIQDDGFFIHSIIAPSDFKVKKGDVCEIEEFNCSQVIKTGKPVVYTNVAKSDLSNLPAYKRCKRDTYIGIPIYCSIKNIVCGTLCFSGFKVRETDFTDSEIDFIQIMSNWISSELNRQITTEKLIKTESATRALYEITADVSKPFEDKVNQLLELCSGFLSTEIGIFGKINKDDYEVVQIVNESDLELQSGDKLAREGSYCARTAELKRPVALHHVGESEYGELPLYKLMKLETYLGVPIEIDDDVFGTICFINPTIRTEPFDQSEIDFIKLVANWIATHQEIISVENKREGIEKKLEISREHQQALIDIQPECFKRVTKNGELIYMNKVGLGLIEADSLDEVKGLCVYDLVVENDRERFIKMNEQVFNGETVSLQFQIEGLKGSRRFMETHASPLFDDKGQVTEHVAITHDISERKRVDDLLLKYEQITACSLDMMAFVDRDYIYRAVNDRHASMLGLTKADIINKPVSRILDKKLYKNTVKPALDKCFQGEYLDFKVWVDIDRKNKRHLHAHYNPYISESGVVEGVAVIIRDITDTKKTELALKETELKYTNLVNDIDAVIWEVKLPELIFTFVSDAAERILGYKREDWYQPGFWLGHIHPDDREHAYSFCSKETLEERDHVFDYRMFHADGHIVWIRDIVHIVKNEQDKLEKLRGVILDITKEKETKAALIETEKRFRTLYDDTPAMFFNTTIDGTILSVNEYGANQLGYNVEELIGLNVEALFHQNDKGPLKKKLKSCLENSHVVHRWELRKLHKKGHTIWVRESVRVVNESGNVSLFIVCEDISEAFQLTQKLNYQASHDALTGLVNRSEFERRLKRVLDSNTLNEFEHALCYLDLDQFKIINDTCGHLAGDELLRQLSEILLSKIRKRDTLARLGGDEFGVLMEHCDLDHANRVANSLREAVEDFRFVWQDKKFSIGVSIGLIPITSDNVNVNEILSAVDAACYAAKDAGRNRIHIYSDEDEILNQRKGEMLWVNRIYSALEENSFKLFYQKIINLKDEHEPKEHYELLIRMLDESGKIISPGAFLPAAERFGLSNKIDRWVFNKAYNWLSNNPGKLNKLGLCSINLSGQTLGDDGFMSFLLEKLNEGRVPPEKICFEITETSAIANLAHAIRFIKKLKERGCYFSLDDFGSGVSSFGYLKNLPVDFLKIDGSFVKDIVTDKIDHAMVKSINDIGHVMGMKTIAEFVENDQILAHLRQLGVDYAQGYCIAKPRALRYSKNKS